MTRSTSPPWRVYDLGLLDVLDADRPAGGGNAPREAPSDRYAHPPLDLLLEALGSPRDQRAAVVLEQEDRRGVHVDDLDHPAQQLRQQLLQRQERERGVGH